MFINRACVIGIQNNIITLVQICGMLLQLKFSMKVAIAIINKAKYIELILLGFHQTL